LNEVKVFLDEFGKSRNRLVEVLFPNVVKCKYTFGNFLSVARSPQLGEFFDDFWIVVRSDFRTVRSALATLVVGDDGSETKDETLREFALTLQINLHARKVTRLVFRERVEHDGGNLVVNEWVVEASKHVLSELLEFVHRKVERLHQLVELYEVDVFAHYRVVASVTHDVDAAEVSHWREHGVRSVEEGHLALVVRLLVVGDDDLETSLVSREFSLELLNGHVLSLLDNPEVECLGLNNEVVTVRDLLADGVNVLARESRNDTVNEGSAYVVVFLEPLFERSVVRAEVVFPEFDVFLDALIEVVSVEEDEFAWHDDETLGRAAVECLESTIEELGQLSRVGGGWFVRKFARVVERDARFGRVGDDETDFRLVGESHERLVLRVRVECAADDIHTVDGVDDFTVNATLEVEVVETILTIEPVNHALVNRLNDYDRGVKVGFLVHVPDNPIDKRTKEVTFAELNDTLWRDHFGRRPLV